MYTYTHTHTYTYWYICIHIHTYTYIYTYTLYYNSPCTDSQTQLCPRRHHPVGLRLPRPDQRPAAPLLAAGALAPGLEGPLGLGARAQLPRLRCLGEPGNGRRSATGDVDVFFFFEGIIGK